MMQLQAGDNFFVKEDPRSLFTAKISIKDRFFLFVGKGINFIQRMWSADKKSEMKHAGVILNAHGVTFESREKIGKYSIYDYKGIYVEIFRNKGMTEKRHKKGWNEVKKHDGKIYPVWRLVLHTVPVLADNIHFIGIPVCSENTAEYDIKAEILPDFKTHWGVNVDELYDYIKNHREWELVFKGVI